MLKQDSEDPVTKDGMDIALCIIDKDKGIIEFAGANNPLLIIGGDEIESIKADKYGIGLLPNMTFPTFNNNIVPLKENLCYYIFSDGYASQFGGIKGEDKFKISNFRNLLNEIHKFDLVTQKQKLYSELESFRNNTPQTDDVLVIGFKA